MRTAAYEVDVAMRPPQARVSQAKLFALSGEEQENISQGGVAEMMKLPIGEEFFGNIRTKGFYYVDKTRFIADL